MSNAYIRGNTITLQSLVVDSAGDPATADTSVKISIFDPDETEKVATQAMSEGVTGTYTYDYTIPADGVLGEWKYRVTVTHSAKVTIDLEVFRAIEALR